MNDRKALIDYIHSFWIRAAIEIHKKIGGLQEPILALVNHGSKINILSTKIYKKDNRSINTNHRWKLRAANDKRYSFYRICQVVGIKISDVEVE